MGALVPLDVDAFLQRVAEQLGVRVSAAERMVRAVFYGLGRVLTSEEIDHLARNLPRDYRPLVQEARREWIEKMPGDEFVARVARRTGLDEAAARRAVNAVLEALAERISGGEVADLMEELPVELHRPLREGDTRSHGAARRMPLDEFLRLVAEREGIVRDQAREHARAVLATLREAVSMKEFADVVGQLPREFRTVVPA